MASTRTTPTTVRMTTEERSFVKTLTDTFRFSSEAATFRALLEAICKRRRAEIVDLVLGDVARSAESASITHQGHVSCGSWLPRTEAPRLVEVPQMFASWMKAGDDDFLMEADGCSMTSDNPRLNIPHGALLVLGYGDAKSNDVCLMRATLDNGDRLYTLKRYGVDSANQAVIHNGRRKEIKPPKNTVDVQAIAVVRRVLTAHIP